LLEKIQYSLNIVLTISQFFGLQVAQVAFVGVLPFGVLLSGTSSASPVQSLSSTHFFEVLSFLFLVILSLIYTKVGLSLHVAIAAFFGGVPSIDSKSGISPLSPEQSLSSNHYLVLLKCKSWSIITPVQATGGTGVGEGYQGFVAPSKSHY